MINSIRYARAGDIVEAQHLEEFAMLARRRDIRPGHAVRMHQMGPLGTCFEAETEAFPYDSPWFGSRNGIIAKVGAGLCNGEVPTLNGQRLNGLDDDNKPTGLPLPTLVLNDKLFGPDRRTWVCLQAKIDPATNRLLSVKDGGLTIVQSADPRVKDGGSEDLDGTGLEPLFMILQPPGGKGFGKLVQIRKHHCKHFYQPGQDGRPARHFFT